MVYLSGYPHSALGYAHKGDRAFRRLSNDHLCLTVDATCVERAVAVHSGACRHAESSTKCVEKIRDCNGSSAPLAYRSSRAADALALAMSRGIRLGDVSGSREDSRLG